MAYTVDQVEVLEKAIAQGATKVKYQDREVNYRSLTEMLQTLNAMKKELGLIPGGIRQKKAEFSKGL